MRTKRLISVALVCATATGCVKRMAVNSVANTLAGGGTGAYLTDDDPILVGDALPFSLKLMESILLETPKHESLLIATASGFVMYAHAYVLQPARRMESVDLAGSRQGRARAKNLFLRGRRYAERALELTSPGIMGRLAEDPAAAVKKLEKEDVPAMYWYAAALGSAISADKNDMGLVADLRIVRALLGRALELDEAWNAGAVHELALVMEASGSEVSEDGGGPEYHFLRAMELNGGRSVGPLVSMAETVCVQEQDRERFTRLLTEALEFDVDAHPETRLANLLAQRHARWLLSQTDQLFIEDSVGSAAGETVAARWRTLNIPGGMKRWAHP